MHCLDSTQRASGSYSFCRSGSRVKRSLPSSKVGRNLYVAQELDARLRMRMTFRDNTALVSWRGWLMLDWRSQRLLTRRMETVSGLLSLRQHIPRMPVYGYSLAARSTCIGLE